MGMFVFGLCLGFVWSIAIILLAAYIGRTSSEYEVKALEAALPFAEELVRGEYEAKARAARQKAG